MASLRHLPGVLLMAGLLAWGGAEALLRWRGEAPAALPRGAGPAMAAPGAGRPDGAAPRGASPREAAAPGPDKATGPGPAPAIATGPGPDKGRPPEAPGPGKGAEPGLALPRLVTPEQDVRWGASLVTTGIRAVDGDSLVRGQERLRLLGIDAPELNQTCRDPANATTVPCGRQALAALDALLRFGGTSCTGVGTDRYGRTLARCLNGRGEELNRAMVLSGWALAAEGDPAYATEERQAAAARRGLHALLFDRPQAWRRAHPR